MCVCACVCALTLAITTKTHNKNTQCIYVYTELASSWLFPPTQNTGVCLIVVRSLAVDGRERGRRERGRRERRERGRRARRERGGKARESLRVPFYEMPLLET